MKLKRVILPLLLTLGLLLALRIAQTLPTEPMAVIIGVAVGIGASVPTSLLLVALLRRERTRPPTDRQEVAP